MSMFSLHFALLGLLLLCPFGQCSSSRYGQRRRPPAAVHRNDGEHLLRKGKHFLKMIGTWGQQLFGGGTQRRRPRFQHHPPFRYNPNSAPWAERPYLVPNPRHASQVLILEPIEGVGQEELRRLGQRTRRREGKRRRKGKRKRSKGNGRERRRRTEKEEEDEQGAEEEDEQGAEEEEEKGVEEEDEQDIDVVEHQMGRRNRLLGQSVVEQNELEHQTGRRNRLIGQSADVQDTAQQQQQHSPELDSPEFDANQPTEPPVGAAEISSHEANAQPQPQPTNGGGILGGARRLAGRTVGFVEPMARELGSRALTMGLPGAVATMGTMAAGPAGGVVGTAIGNYAADYVNTNYLRKPSEQGNATAAGKMADVAERVWKVRRGRRR